METAPGTLADFLTLGWDRLIRGVGDRHAAARHPTLATVDSAGAPTQRTVVLRGAVRAEARIEVHTDAASAKVAHLTRDPRVAFHVWDDKANLQLRLTAHAEILVGTLDQWERLPEAARRVYGGHPLPGSPVPEAEAFQPSPYPDRYTVLQCHLDTMELLHLGRDLHRRAVFARASGWSGQWIAP